MKTTKTLMVPVTATFNGKMCLEECEYRHGQNCSYFDRWLYNSQDEVTWRQIERCDECIAMFGGVEDAVSD